MAPLALLLLLVAPPQTTALAVAAPADLARRAYVGIYLSDVSGFDLREGRFQADLDVWLKWTGAAEPPALRFVNGEIETREEQERESDGAWHSVRWRVQGTFRGTFPLHAFPFDHQQLRIELAVPEDTAHLLPDLASSGMAQQFSITGWEYEPFFRAETGRERLASDLGSIRSEGHARTLESVDFVVDLKRPATSNILKFMLPLAIILAMAFLVFALPWNTLDVRSAMGVTALLSVVAFHFAMSGSLPDVPYLVAADRLFLGSYVLVLLSVLETVIVFRTGERSVPRARRIDRVSAVVLTVSAALVAVSVVTVPLRLETPAEAAAEPEAPEPPAPKSAQEEAPRIAVPTLSTPTAGGLSVLLRRGLTHMNADGVLRPHLAEAVPAMTDESVRLLPDGGMLVRWRLREGLKWSDGAPITSDDLVFSLGQVADPDRAEVTRVDARTVTIRYRRRLASALTDFTLYPAHVAREVARDGGVDALRQRNQSEPFPGDGPYRLVRFVADTEAQFERNPHFRGAPAAFARVVVRVVAPEEVGAALERGSLDFAHALPADVADALRTLEPATVATSVDETLLFVQPDLGVAPWSDPRARRALQHALDRAVIARAYAGASGRPAASFRPPGTDDHAEDVPQVPFDPTLARRLFAEAGGAPTAPLKLFHPDLPKQAGLMQALAVVVQQVAEVGITAEPVKLSSSKVTDAFNKASHGGLLLHARKDVRAARWFNLPMQAGVLDTRTPRAHWDARAIDLNQSLETSLFPERRALLSMRLQHLFAERLPLLPLAFGAQAAAHRDALVGYGPGLAASPFWNVERWSVPPAVVEAPLAP